MQFKIFVVAIIFFIVSKECLAAACCGGGSAAPSIISGDNLSQISTSISSTDVVIDNVDADGIWRTWDKHQQVKTLRLDAAHLIGDRWQTSATVPFMQRSRLSKTTSGIGDLATSLGYEYLPDWDYNPYRPKGIGFLQLTFPTGISRAESETGTESRGNGFWALGVGTLLTKSWGAWDVFSTVEVHRSFQKSVDNPRIKGTLKPGFGGNGGFGFGFNTKSMRFGSSLSWTYEDPVAITGSINVKGAAERYATASLSTSYVHSDEWSSTASYSDQTLFGSPVNTSLGKSVALSVQRKWLR